MSLAGFWPQLQWREPLWLLLVLYPWLVALLLYLRNTRRLNHYADHKLLPWLLIQTQGDLKRRLLSRNAAYVLAWLLLAIAMAGPRSSVPLPGKEGPGSLDIMIVLDVSRSMQASDIRPSRLQRARIEIHELMNRSSDARIGLIVYAGRPHLYVPLTSDKKALAFYLQMLDAVVLPTRGSQTASALQMAGRELSDSRQSAVVLLMSDGDVLNRPQDRPSLLAAARTLGTQNRPLYVLGVGSVEGEAVPLAEGGWLKQQGRAVISRMDEGLLQQLAITGRGKYQAVTDDDSDWLALYDKGMQTQARPRRTDSDDTDVVWKEYFPWLLFPAIVLLFYALMPYRLPALRSPRKPDNITPVLLAGGLGLLLLVMPLQVSVAASGAEAAWQAFVKQDYASAQERYETLPGYTGRFGEAASRYRQGDFSGAVRQFTQAVLQANNPGQRGLALYNLGNSYVQLGQFRLAAEIYEDALRYLPGHRPSQQNLETSLALQAQVEERLKNDILSGRVGRAGRGPRKADAEAGVELDESASVSLGEQSEGTGSPGKLPVLPLAGNAQLAMLIERGVEQARLAARGESSAQRREHQQDRLAARMRMSELRDNRALPWKRLFEMEEGFPAPLQTPRPLPGVKPW